MLNRDQLNQLASYIRSSLIAKFDPAAIFAEPEGQLSLQSPHKGFYVGIVDSSDNEMVRSGFLQEDLTNVKDSANIVIQNLYEELKQKNAGAAELKTATFHFCIISECAYMSDPLAWNENADGIYFMWGQKYKGLYLPYQIRRMNIAKIDLMDRLCSWEAGVASNLWRLQEGLCWRLACQSHTA